MAQISKPNSTVDLDSGAVQRGLILATCTVVTVLYAMTITIANVSLPQLQGALSATQDQITWVVTFNIVATAVATPMSGWLVARLGRRRLLIFSILGFTVSSLLCGTADSLGALVLFRILQGACGAPLAPVCQAIVQDTYPKHQHGTVIALFGMGVIIGPIIGPVAGGYLSEAYSWRWVFFMIVPFSLLALAGVLVFIRETGERSQVSLDWIGFLSLSAAVSCLQVVLDRGERADWFASYEIIILTCLAVGALYLFVGHVTTTERPFLRPALFRDRNFLLGVILMFAFGLLNFTPITLLPTILQNLRGYPDSVIGYVLSIRGMGTFAGFIFMIWGSRLDPRVMITVGFLTQAISGWYMGQMDLNVTMSDIFWPMVIQGLGVGLLWPSITVVTFSTLRQEYLVEGTALYHLIRNFGSSIYISLSVALVMRTAGQNYSQMSQFVSPFNDSFRMPWVSGQWNMDTVEGLSHLSGEITRQAAMIGYLNSFQLFSVTAVLALPLILLIRWQRPDTASQETDKEEKR